MADNYLMLIGHELTEAAIARVLRSGSADQRFLDGLAMLLDPPPGKKPRYSLRLSFKAASRPRGAKIDEAALVAELRALAASLLSRGKKKQKRAEILERLKVSSGTATAALRRAKKREAIWAWMLEHGDQLRGEKGA